MPSDAGADGVVTGPPLRGIPTAVTERDTTRHDERRPGTMCGVPGAASIVHAVPPKMRRAAREIIATRPGPSKRS
jgi:hypothetical protein